VACLYSQAALGASPDARSGLWQGAEDALWLADGSSVPGLSLDPECTSFLVSETLCPELAAISLRGPQTTAAFLTSWALFDASDKSHARGGVFRSTMVGFSGRPPRAVHSIGAHLTTSATPVRISPEEQIETTAERADPESLIGLLQTRDVFADSRVVRVVGQVATLSSR